MMTRRAGERVDKRMQMREGISMQDDVCPSAIVCRKSIILQNVTTVTKPSSPARSSPHYEYTMVVAEFTDANDTHPKVVAGTEPTAEQTTTSASTAEKTSGGSSTSADAGKAASGESKTSAPPIRTRTTACVSNPDLKDKVESSTSATASDIKDKIDSSTSDLQSKADSTLSDVQKKAESSTSANVGEDLPGTSHSECCQLTDAFFDGFRCQLCPASR